MRLHTASLLIVVLAVLPSCGSESAARRHPRVIVIGLDPRLCQRMMDAGELPHRAMPGDAGGYRPLATSTPPQSPVTWATTLGNITDEIHSDNDSAWSADHCMATEEGPGVILPNRTIRHPDPLLIDVAPTISREFGLQPPADMEGTSVFENRAVARRTGHAKE